VFDNRWHGAIRVRTQYVDIPVALLSFAGFALVACLVLTNVARRRRIDTIAAQMEMQIAMLNPLYRDRGISFSLYSEVGAARALVRWERGPSASVQEQPLSTRVI
jgi:hypothetical protein